jgi:hypothetical protein
LETPARAARRWPVSSAGRRSHKIQQRASCRPARSNNEPAPDEQGPTTSIVPDGSGLRAEGRTPVVNSADGLERGSAYVRIESPRALWYNARVSASNHGPFSSRREAEHHGGQFVRRLTPAYRASPDDLNGLFRHPADFARRPHRRARPASFSSQLWLKDRSPVGADISLSRALLSRGYHPGHLDVPCCCSVSEQTAGIEAWHALRSPPGPRLEFDQANPHFWKPLPGTNLMR